MMLVTPLGFGRVWEQRIGKDPSDPLRYSSHAAYYNTSGIEIDGRVCYRWRVGGKLRFNGGSGFDTNRPTRNLGKVFECGEPEERGGGEWVQVLFYRRLPPQQPDFFLVALRSEDVGRVYMPRSGWKSDDTYLISCSVHRNAQEMLILMKLGSWVNTEAGRLVVLQDAKRFGTATLSPQE